MRTLAVVVAAWALTGGALAQDFGPDGGPPPDTQPSNGGPPAYGGPPPDPYQAAPPPGPDFYQPTPSPALDPYPSPPPPNPYQPAPAPTPAPIAGGTKALDLGQIQTAVSTTAAVFDVVGHWAGPRPTPKPQFGWADSPAFDMQVHESLVARMDKVNVQVDGAYGARGVPERMNQWLDQVKRRGGMVSTCAVMDGSRGIFKDIATIVSVVQAVDQWKLYEAAAGYSVLVLVTPYDRLVRNVVFVRGAAGPCPVGTMPSGNL